MTALQRRSYTTLSDRGLRHDILPMRLYHKAKKLGIWDPRSIDMTQDRLDWQQFPQDRKERLIRLIAGFQAGEEAVTLDLLPLILTMAREGRLEEEMFLTTFLWEEAKHTEFFRRFLDEVAHEQSDLHYFHTPSYRKLFYEELPATMHALLHDSSPRAQARASVTYNMVIEGVLAETGYQTYADMLETNHLMPGLRQGIGYLKRDESRHIAYGIYLISRLVAQDPSLWSVVEERMNELLPLALGVVQESDTYPEGTEDADRAFGLNMQNYLGFAMMQFNKRVARIEKARTQTLDQLYELAENEDEIEV